MPIYDNLKVPVNKESDTMMVLNERSSETLCVQIYNKIKSEILSGNLSVGSKLPSTRTLSKSLNVSRNTVEAAYQQLSSEGYIKSKPCSGYIVEEIHNLEITDSEVKSSNANVNHMTEANFNKDNEEPYLYDFKYGALSSGNFPLNTWRKLTNQCLSSISAEKMLCYNDPKGEIELRIEIMKYLSKSRGVHCTPNEIILCAGVQNCLEQLSVLFSGYSKQVAFEEPGYIGSRDVFINNSYEIIPIPVEEDGLDIEKLEASNEKIVYVTPSHQYPTGAVLPIHKRLKLLDWAKRKDGIIIEDDYDSEFRYNSKPIPSIQSIDSNGQVVYIGTFSKSLAPSLRMSYMVLPKKWIEKYDKIFGTYNCQVPWLQQKVLEEFMSLGHWDSHLRKITHSYKKKHDTLIQCINTQMENKVVIHGKNAGLHILLEFKDGLTEVEAINRAKKVGVKVYPVAPYFINPKSYKNNMVCIGFSGMSEESILQGIALLKDAWFNK